MDGSVLRVNVFLRFWLSLVSVVTAWVGMFPIHALSGAS
jgi:hypothetical protein